MEKQTYTIDAEQKLRKIVKKLDAQKEALYDIASTAYNNGDKKTQSECYDIIRYVQQAMDKAMQIADNLLESLDTDPNPYA